MDLSNKTLEQLWNAKKGSDVIAIDLFGNVIVLKGIADMGDKRAYGVMHETSKNKPGLPVVLEHDKDIWKSHKPKTNFYGMVLYNKILKMICRPTKYYQSKEEAKKNISEEEKLIAWEIESRQI